ncbi:N-6 DNA methylase [Pseudomonas veronii]
MNDLKNQIVSLKKTIFKISNNPAASDTHNQDLSFKTFVQIGLLSSIENLAQRYVHYGLPKAELGNHIATGDALLGFQGTEQEAKFIDNDALANAINLYNEIIKESEPFEDILSLLAQDILLTRGRGKAKGQFMTPPEIAKFLAKVIYKPKEENKTHSFCDPCVGYGALLLSHLWNQHREDPESLNNIEIVVNDIDPFMCHVTALQILSNTAQHNIDVKSFLVLCSNAITQYDTGDTKFVVSFITPEVVSARIEEIQTFKLVQDLMREVLVAQPTKNKSKDSETLVGAA